MAEVGTPRNSQLLQPAPRPKTPVVSPEVARSIFRFDPHIVVGAGSEAGKINCVLSSQLGDQRSVVGTARQVSGAESDLTVSWFISNPVN